MPTSSQKEKLRRRVQEAEMREKLKDQEIARLKQQLAAATDAGSSSLTTTPSGRFTPSQHTSPPRRSAPQAATSEVEEEGKGDGPDEDTEDGDDEGVRDGNSAAEEAEEGDEGHTQKAGDRDMHIMRQLPDDLRVQKLSPAERETLIRSAGGQFADMLAQNWKEDSEPPSWLVSLFRPSSNQNPTPASAAQVTQGRVTNSRAGGKSKQGAWVLL